MSWTQLDKRFVCYNKRWTTCRHRREYTFGPSLPWLCLKRILPWFRDPKLCSLPNDPAEDITTATLQVQSIADEHSFDQMVAELFNDSAESLLLKHLSKELYSSLLDVKTEPFESTLLDCIRCYTRNKVGRPDIGLFATDSDCYNKFVGLFGSIVDELYAVDATVVQPQCEWGDATQLGFLDPSACNIQWIKVVCRRSIDGELFTPRTSELQLNGILDKVKAVVTLNEFN